MHDQIKALSDTDALRILTVLVRRHRENAETDLSGELRAALQEKYDVGPVMESPSEGELARQALLLLSEEPEARAGLAALLTGPAPQRFDAGLSIAITAAVLIVLQTRVRFERDARGKLKWLVEKKPTDAALLKPLVQKLISYFP